MTYPAFRTAVRIELWQLGALPIFTKQEHGTLATMYLLQFDSFETALFLIRLRSN